MTENSELSGMVRCADSIEPKVFSFIEQFAALHGLDRVTSYDCSFDEKTFSLDCFCIHNNSVFLGVNPMAQFFKLTVTQNEKRAYVLIPFASALIKDAQGFFKQEISELKKMIETLLD